MIHNVAEHTSSIIDKAGMRTKLGRITTAFLIVFGGLSLDSAVEISHPSTAHADTIDDILASYPDKNDACQSIDVISPAQTPTKASPYVSCRFYDWGVQTPTKFIFYSTRGYEYRNCTDWAAFRVNQASNNTINIPSNLGNANTWYNESPAYEKSLVAKAGEVAVSTTGTYGHVAFVESVSADKTTMVVSEFNYDMDGHGDKRTLPTNNSEFTEYVNFGVVMANSGPTAQPGPFKYSPSALKDTSGNFHVFDNTSGGIDHFTHAANGTWPGEVASQESDLSSTPASFVDSNGYMNVFTETTTGINHFIKGPNGTWGGEAIAQHESDFIATPVAFQDTAGDKILFVQTTGGINEYEQAPGASWRSGVVTTDSLKPGIAANIDSAGNVDVYAAASGSGLNQYRQVAGGNGTLPGTVVSHDAFTTGPAADVDRLGDYNVYAETSGGLDHFEQAPGGIWGGEPVAGGTFNFSPAVYTNPWGDQFVYVGTSGGINEYEKDLNGSSWNGQIVTYDVPASTPYATNVPVGGNNEADLFVNTSGGVSHYQKPAGSNAWLGESVSNGH